MSCACTSTWVHSCTCFSVADVTTASLLSNSCELFKAVLVMLRELFGDSFRPGDCPRGDLNITGDWMLGDFDPNGDWLLGDLNAALVTVE